jgi:hypothetical protein|tara:strand:+ start:7299 stop:8195 length:897 start_codon:yes stop_codon:yes gene_type:complete
MREEKTLTHAYYGDNVRWFVGTVVDHTPPYGYEGRVRVRIHGVHSPKIADIPERDLPWAQVLIPGTEGGVSGIGRNPQILSGSLVMGIFGDGKSSQIPIILGTLPRTELPTTTQLRKSINLASNENVYDFGVSALIAKQLPSDSLLPPISIDTVINARKSEAVKHFIDGGYTLEQAAAIVAGLELTSKLNYVITAPQGDLRGIGGWNNKRLNDFIMFIENYETLNNPAAVLIQNYFIQLEFVLYELRTFKSIVNGKLLRSRRLFECCDIMSRYYFDNSLDAQAVFNLAEKIKEEIYRG